MGNIRDLIYYTRCRHCNIINDNWISTNEQMDQMTFEFAMIEKSKYPIHRQCSCSNGKMTVQDLISYTLYL